MKVCEYIIWPTVAGILEDQGINPGQIDRLGENEARKVCFMGNEDLFDDGRCDLDQMFNWGFVRQYFGMEMGDIHRVIVAKYGSYKLSQLISIYGSRQWNQPELEVDK